MTVAGMSNAIRCCLPEFVRERQHSHPPLALTICFGMLLIAVVAAAVANEKYQVNIPFFVFLIFSLLFSSISLALESMLYYKLKAQANDPQAPTSYMEMTNTTVRNEAHPIRRDALKYDINNLEHIRSSHESALTRSEVIDTSPFLSLTRQSIQLVMPASVSIALILFIRLCFVDHFSTIPIRLNYGPKATDSDEGQYEEDSIAFTPDITSYGHWIQGVLAGLFLFPAVTALLFGKILSNLSRDEDEGSKRKRRWILLFVDIFAACMTIYASYNFIKRLVKTTDVFATSSYSNNATEWVVGVAVGSSLGVLCTSYYKYYTLFVNTEIPVGGQDGQYKSQLNSDSPFAANNQSLPLHEKCALYFIWFTTRGLLQVVSYSSGIMMGLTWNTCYDNGNDCVNYANDGNPNAGIIVLFVILPILVQVFFSLYFYYRGCE